MSNEELTVLEEDSSKVAGDIHKKEDKNRSDITSGNVVLDEAVQLPKLGESSSSASETDTYSENPLEGGIFSVTAKDSLEANTSKNSALGEDIADTSNKVAKLAQNTEPEHEQEASQDTPLGNSKLCGPEASVPDADKHDSVEKDSKLSPNIGPEYEAEALQDAALGNSKLSEAEGSLSTGDTLDNPGEVTDTSSSVELNVRQKNLPDSLKSSIKADKTKDPMSLNIKSEDHKKDLPLATDSESLTKQSGHSSNSIKGNPGEAKISSSSVGNLTMAKKLGTENINTKKRTEDLENKVNVNNRAIESQNAALKSKIKNSEQAARYCSIYPVIEAILFAGGVPVSVESIAKVLSIPKKEAQNALDGLKSELECSTRGIRIIKVNGKYQMCSKAEYGEQIRKLMNIKPETLSGPALEVLSIVAYYQPVTKAFIENVRGVNCREIVNSLVSKSLIEEKGRLDIPGNPIIYGTSENFLLCLGITSIDELPPVPEKKETVND